MTAPAERQLAHESLETQLVTLMRRLRRMSAVLTREADDGLEASIYALLGAFLDVGDVRAGDLAYLFGLDKSTVSRQVARLESLGLVERVVDPKDKRARMIRITDEGRRRVLRLRTVHGQWLNAALDTWPAADVDRLSELLAQLNAALGAELTAHRAAATPRQAV
ncbi:MarR family winged helix-turn-helix transcriptional regulator [Phytoactinopolyspora limicola]|uniref:MarR family winged helix-turn-helix transcriptional regulator n=1 Tax=Phytoactinopolyspora limicola TaxID=2715536 RepID=UPI00140A6099|nr:MarR family transcriptional regulator [Phytoactinopolyspora limicola]